MPKKKRKVGSEASIEKKKSFAKGMGVKSTLVSGSKVYMTTFAEGSDARLEKIVEGDSIRSVNEGEAFSAEMADKNAGYKIGNAKFSHPKGYAVVANNPLYTGPVQQDMLGLKETLEKRYFGESADGNDNICIQVIHNILDIEKILAEYITNAAYAVNNISGLDKDIIGFGKFSTVYTYDEFKDPEHHRAAFNNNDKLINAIKAQYDEFDNFLDNPRLGYFGQAFFSKEGRNYIINYGNECYDILALLSGLAHWVVANNEEESRISRTWLYNLDKNLDNEYISTLNYLYDRITNELTNSFSKNSAANVNYIAETLGINPAEFAEQYFRFSIMKEQKNLGFNITKLREVMLDRKDMSEIRKNHKVFDSIRTKVYTMMDFVIYRYYIEEDAKVAAANKSLPDNEKSLSEKDIFVINLRGSFNDDQKDALYYDEANRIWRKLENIMHNIKEFRGNKTREYKKKDAPRLPRILPAGRDVSAFSKLMYALTMFLDGKEINDLLTTLINKFDNIQSFLKVMPLIGVNAKFVEEYAFFKDSAKIADELRLIKSFARMGEPIADARRAMYIDAIRILGTNLSYDELKALADTFSLDENGNKLKKGKHGMRNFIINNVISNKRFHYLIRYGDPAHLHEIAKNEAVVKFVLGRIADIQKKQGQNGKNQIDRYYETCIGKDKGKSVSEKVDALTKIITGMNYDQFDKKRSVIEDTGRENAEREKFKKIISLYLTVIYHILKNIVNINARYVIGFHCVERDAQLYKEKGYDINLKKLEEKGFSSVTKLCAGIDETAPDKRKDVEKEMAERAKESIDSLESANPKLYANYIKYSDEKKAEEFTRQINREKAKTALNAYLRNTKWNVIIREDLLRIDNKTCTLFANKAVALEVARYVHAYINDIAEVNSYFQLYHYIMQRIIMNERYEKSSGKVSEYFDAVNDEKKYNDRLLKLLCVPFGYCIPRFKNLSIEALFDRNEAAKFDKEKKKVSGNSGSGTRDSGGSMESNSGGEDTVATIKSIRTQLETRIQDQHATHLDLLASLQTLDPNIVPTLDLSLRFVSAFNRRSFSPTPPLPTPKKISHPPQHPPTHSVPDPKQLALVKPEGGDKFADESGNPLLMMRAMVAECLLQRVPFKAIDSSTVLRKLENDENITTAEKAAMRELGGDSGAILAVEMALRSMAEDNGGLEIEEFVVGGKSRVMVLSIDRTRLVRELPEEPQNHQKRERINNVNESENLKMNSNSNNEWLAPRPMSEIWMGGGDPGMMYPPGGPMAGPRGWGMGMMGRPPMAPNSGLLPSQRQSTEEDDLKDLEALLNKKSFKEMQKSKTGEEILNIINRPTARETAVAAKFKSKGGSQVREYCSALTKEDCRRQSGSFLACKKVHFKRIIAPHTDISLGDCSFLDTCRHMKTCKYVHYELDQTQDDLGPEKPLKPPRAEYCSEVELGEPQWINCDIRNFRMDILGQFGVIMADPPWDIHMELPYGTMADDEMRNLNVPALQTDGLIFLWVTGRAMELGRECLEQWGYKRCEEIIWVKTNQLQRIIRTGRTGHWLNHSKEHCLVGIKGNPEINKNIDTDVIVAEVRETSRKPDEMYPMLERISPRTRKLELFARMHNTHAGWISLGNQLNGVRLVDEGLRARYKAAYPHVEVQPLSPPKASAMELDSTSARSPFATESRSQFADPAAPDAGHAPEERAMAVDTDMTTPKKKRKV